MDNESLRKLCSDVTLQSQKEGFFNQWADQVENLLTNKFFIQFCQLNSDKERFQLTWKQECVHSLQIQECFTPKKLNVCEEKRMEGNKAFQANDDNKALLLYSQAVIRAPPEGEALSLCFANRSAALFHSKSYKLCLQDIDLALLHGYPNRLKYKILERRGQCLAKFGRKEESETAFQESILAVQDSDLSDTKKQAWVQETLKKMSINIDNSEETQEYNNCCEVDVYKEKLYKNESKIFPRASSTLTLKCTEEAGRYMAASEDIPAVKVLVRELPFSSVLMQEKRGSFCENCFKKIIAPIPCKDCSGVTFCSPECQSIGLKSYHKWECHYLNLFKASGMSLNCFLALRVVTERGFEFFKTNCSQDLKSTEMPSKKSPHNPDDFKNFYNLVGLEEQRNPRDFFRRSLMAVFLVKVLQHSGFFKNKFTEENNNDELLIGAILLRNLQVIQFNAHEVSGIAFEGKRAFNTCKSIYLGLAVYPTVSFFNHSCYPAVGRYFNGKEMAVVNLRPLKKGEMVAENYGPIFTHLNRDQRQKKLLSRYWFKCKCEACEGDWPIYNDMPNKITFIEPSEIKEENKNKKKRNKNKNMKQSNVRNENSKETLTDFDEGGKENFSTNIQKYFDLGKSLMDEFKREEAIEEYKKFVEVVTHKVKLPLKDLHLSLECLRLLVGARGSSYVIQK